MKKCIIVGSVRTVAFNEKEKAPDTLYVAADGGYAQMKECGITPDLLLGDFDSLSEIAEKSAAVSGKPSDGEESGYSEPPSCVEIIRFPVEKDDTDTVFAVKEAVKRGFDNFLLIGVVGARLDHTLGNVSILLYLESIGRKGIIIDDYSEMEIVSKEPAYIEDSYAFFSLLNISGTARGIKIENAKYPLDESEITCKYQYGISNEVLRGKKAMVTVKEGNLLLVKIK
jgi:thiamine pyrophosphokinase